MDFLLVHPFSMNSVVNSASKMYTLISVASSSYCLVRRSARFRANFTDSVIRPENKPRIAIRNATSQVAVCVLSDVTSPWPHVGSVFPSVVILQGSRRSTQKPSHVKQFGVAIANPVPSPAPSSREREDQNCDSASVIPRHRTPLLPGRPP